MSVGSIADTGLKAAMLNMEAISNNISNANTIGFKKSHVNFSDIYASSFSGVKSPGFGVQASSISQDFSIGRVEGTGRALDLSIGNDGFFVQKNPSGQISYTRAGRMEMDQNGYLLCSTGRLQGYPSVNGNIVSSGVLSDLQVSTNAAIPAKATGTSKLTLNLDAAATVPANAFNVNDVDSYNFKSDSKVYDSLGNSYDMSVYYVKTADNTWSTQVVVNNQNIATGNVVFQPDGTIATATGMSGMSFTPPGGSATPQLLDLDITGSTQFAGKNEKKTIEQDGYPAGIPIGFDIDADGKINMTYSNGETQVQGQVALARFRAPERLQKSEGMSWVATNDSGDPLLDPATSMSAFGTQKLEFSNVDLTEELVRLMGAQHDFQANAQVTQTYNQVLKTIENL